MLEQFFTPYQAGSAVKGQRIAILAPHPDDEIFGCGASASQWVAEGKEVRVYILTAGVAVGEFDQHPDKDALVQAKAQQRANESLAAALELGLPEPIFLNGQDGQLWQEPHLEAALLEALQAWQPTTLVIPSVWEMHRDHRAAAEMGLRIAQVLADTMPAGCLEQISQYEIGVPLQANVLQDITERETQKWQAMQCFSSQLATQYYAEQIQGLNRFRAYTLGLEVRAAEAFHCVSLSELPTWLSLQAPAAASEALRSAEQTLSESKQMHDEMARKLASVELALNDAEQQLQATYQTLSWRITKPVRWLRKHLP